MTAYPLKLPDRLYEEAAQYAETQGISLEQFIIGAIAEKVGMFRQPADDPAFPQITYRKGSSGQYTPILIRNPSRRLAWASSLSAIVKSDFDFHSGDS